MLVIAHLSDTHFGGHPSAVERATRVVDHLLALDPPVDAVLVTGDVADHGLREEYADARDVLGRLEQPIFWCPGNHDVREEYAAMRGLPGDRPQDQPVNEAHHLGDHLFLMLDSLVSAVDGVRQDHGHLTQATLDWLDERLAARAKGQRAFVCFHHPPVEIHIDLMDPIRLDNSDELAEVLGRHADVSGVLVGHAHTACTTSYAGLPLLIGGGVASTVALDAEPYPPVTHDLGPSFAVHFVGDDGRIVTHWRTL